MEFIHLEYKLSIYLSDKISLSILFLVNSFSLVPHMLKENTLF